MIKKLELNLYENLRGLIFRYFEIYGEAENKSLIFSAMININLGVQDINKIIENINEEKDYDSSLYYELVIKAYQILNAFSEIEKKFKVVKSGHNDLYGIQDESDADERKNERQKFDYFRALRSLTTAHALNTTEKTFEKFGITKGVYLEDVRTSDSYKLSRREGDITLEIREENLSSKDFLGEVYYRGVWLDRDVIEPVRIILSKLKLVNKKLEDLINLREDELKNKKIECIESINKNFLKSLKAAVLERYPKEIDTVTYTDENTVEYWMIQEIFDFVNWQYEFGDDRDSKLKALQEEKKKELLLYAQKVQGMNLNLDMYYDLSSGIDKKGICNYAQEKIKSYLSWSKNVVDIEKINRWKDKLEGARQVNQVSDEVWGCLMLWEIQPELNEFFELAWEMTVRELYWQYLVALFVRQGSILL